MKNILFLLGVAFIFSCNNAKNDEGNDKTSGNDSSKSTNKETAYVPEIQKTTFNKSGADFYIISVGSTTDVDEAVRQVKDLRVKGHPAGYLWIPEFPSLSKKEIYSVFIGPFNSMDTTIKYLENYKKTDPNAYAVRVAKESKRTTILGKFDIRINDIRQYLILTYAKPKEVEEYFNEGGEDWGWFTGDVWEYFNKNYPEKVLMSSVYMGWLTPSDIKTLERELSLDGFGYIFINGKKKSFTVHDMPDGVISNACAFFGLEYKKTEE